MNRRDALKLAATASALTLFPTIGLAGLHRPSPKLIWIILRGAQDGLSTLIPHNEPLLAEYRPTLWPKLKPNIIKLNENFSLHPKLTFFKKLYDDNQLIAVPAVGTGYQGRSHFEGQDFMECGLKEIDYSSGWIGRLLNVINSNGVAISPNQPVCMRGTERASNWYPTKLPQLDSTAYEELLALYGEDETLQTNLNTALKIRGAIGNGDRNDSSFASLCESCGSLMTNSSEYSIATLELSGWDTHKNQHNQLMKQMDLLNQGVTSLKASLKGEWNNTSVIISTEFGRTVRENGTGGTDHGTASTLFITGGNVKQSVIPQNWIELKQRELFENRDLFPTSISYHWIALALKTGFKLTNKKVEDVFPHTK